MLKIQIALMQSAISILLATGSFLPAWFPNSFYIFKNPDPFVLKKEALNDYILFIICESYFLLYIYNALR